MKNTRATHLHAARRAGMALTLVVFAIAIAAVLGAAILASTSMQVQVKGNMLAAAQADYLADSGVNLGIYRLQHPQTAPLLNSDGFYPGENNLSVGADVPGTVELAISNVGTSTYNLAATAHFGPNPSNQAARTATAKVYVKTKYLQTEAASFAGDFTIPAFMSVSGNARCDGSLLLSPGGSISGSVHANASNAPVFTAPPTFPVLAAPKITDIEIWNTTGAATPYYNYVDVDGTTKTGYPQPLSAVTGGALIAVAANPKNVWYADSTVVLVNVTLNGTLVMRNPAAQLAIMDTAHITAMDNMPAIVSAGPIAFDATADPKELNIEGLCWIGANITTIGAQPATNCNMLIDGALLCGTSVHAVNANYGGSINVTFNASKVNVPNFSTVGATPQSVKILRWGI
jgi:hypothetical protein